VDARLRILILRSVSQTEFQRSQAQFLIVKKFIVVSHKEEPIEICMNYAKYLAFFVH
jgi:hypothetical protein